MTEIDQEYVSEILASMPRGLTQQEFYARCVEDANAGYVAEVDAAWRKYKDDQ